MTREERVQYAMAQLPPEFASFKFDGLDALPIERGAPVDFDKFVWLYRTACIHVQEAALGLKQLDELFYEEAPQKD